MPIDTSRHHDRLHAAMIELEDVLVGPVTDTETWQVAVDRALHRLHVAVTGHVRATEGPDGLFDQVVAASAGRLAPAAERLRREHHDLLSALERLSLTGIADSHEQRDRILALLTDLSRHRHRAAELLYEAYEVDISTAD
jgi:hypothetical protein